MCNIVYYDPVFQLNLFNLKKNLLKGTIEFDPLWYCE
jgi:hypothetical protein